MLCATARRKTGCRDAGADHETFPHRFVGKPRRHAGLIDIKITEVENADRVARAIKHAAQLLGDGRRRYVHPNCGFSILKRWVAEAKIRALIEARDLYMGH